MSHRHILLPIAALAVAACGDRSPIDSGPIPASSEVASITLAADSLTLDMRSAAPQTIRYSIVNTAGESLCGRVPVSVQADTAAFSAHLSPADPCLITLTPRAERSGWLRVQAGTKQVSAPVSVHRRRFRWDFDLPGGPLAAGTMLHPTVTVWGDNDKPVAGIPVRFSLDYRADQQVTGPDGVARGSLAVPYSTRLESIGLDSSRTFWQNLAVGAEVGDPIQGGWGGNQIEVVAGAPHHVGIYIYRLKFTEFCDLFRCTLSEYYTAYEAVPGDSVGLSSYDQIYATTSPFHCEPDGQCWGGEEMWHTRLYQRETLVAVVADQYGNPTATLPTLSNPTGTRVEIRDRFLIVSKAPVCCLWEDWTGGRAMAVFATDNVYPKVLTFTSPGVPPRTFTLKYSYGG